MVSTNLLDGSVLLPEGAGADAPGRLLVARRGGKGAEVCSPRTEVRLQTVKVSRMGCPSGTELVCLQQVVVMSLSHLKAFACPKFW